MSVFNKYVGYRSGDEDLVCTSGVGLRLPRTFSGILYRHYICGLTYSEKEREWGLGG